MNSTYSITSKFQVTIPKEIRDELKLTDRDKVSFERRGEVVVIKKALTLDEVRELLQADLKRRGWNKAVADKDIKNAPYEFHKKGMKWE